MQYIIHVETDSEIRDLYTAPVDGSDADYLTRALLHLKPLSPEQYIHGLAAIFQTAARYSYVLDGNELLVCIEWDPGLIVVKVSSNDKLQWLAVRSPIPNFGGRDPLPEDGDPDEYDSEDNPQYNLVYTPWDAQFDNDDREYYKFDVAGPEIRTKFQDLLAIMEVMSKNVPTYGQEEQETWRRNCFENLTNWSGTGVRL